MSVKCTAPTYQHRTLAKSTTLLVSFGRNHDNKTALKPDEPVPVCSASAAAAAATCCSHGCRGGALRGERSPLMASIPLLQLSLSLAVTGGGGGRGCRSSLSQIDVSVNLDVIFLLLCFLFQVLFDGFTEEERK